VWPGTGAARFGPPRLWSERVALCGARSVIRTPISILTLALTLALTLTLAPLWSETTVLCGALRATCGLI